MSFPIFRPDSLNVEVKLKTKLFASKDQTFQMPSPLNVEKFDESFDKSYDESSDESYDETLTNDYFDPIIEVLP